MSLATASFPALGTTAEVTTLDPLALSDAIDVLERELDAIDRACSRFRADSEISRLAESGGQWMPASRLLREALHTGISAAETTGGSVDPTVGASLRALGWDADFRVVVADGTDGGAERLERVLATDPGMGVLRHVDAGYPEAIETARDHGLPVPMQDD